MTDETKLGLAQSTVLTHEPVAWRYQRKEGWERIWRYSSRTITSQDFETPNDWIVEPLYAALAPGNAAQRQSQPSDEWCNAFLRATGEWVEPYEPETECGVPIECGLTQEDADQINAEAREQVRKGYAAALALGNGAVEAVGEWTTRVQGWPPVGKTSSDGGVEVRHAKTGNMPGSVPGEEMSPSATSFERMAVQGVALEPCAGVTTGPSETPSPAAALDPATVEACAKVAAETGQLWGDNYGSSAYEAADKIRALIGQPAPGGASEAVCLGSIVRMNEKSPYFQDWRDATLKVVSLRVDPEGRQWVSVIEGSPRHRANGVYDSETTDIDADYLDLVSSTHTASDGAIYAAVSQRDIPPEERAALEAEIRRALEDQDGESYAEMADKTAPHGRVSQTDEPSK